MPAIVSTHREQIARICRDNGIRRLDLFGSATHDGFTVGRSDLDFYVDLGEYDGTVGRRYLRVISSLIRLFGRDSDVVTTRGVRDDEFRAEIERTRHPLCEA